MVCISVLAQGLGFKYEYRTFLQLTEAFTYTNTVAEMLPLTPGSPFQSSNSDNAYL